MVAALSRGQAGVRWFKLIIEPENMMLKLLFLSTPVGPLGSGLGGGVELTLMNLTLALQSRGHHITIVAPTDSVVPGQSVIEIAGQWQILAQHQSGNQPITLPVNSVLANMWAYAQQHQLAFDLIVNFAYDWLPFYLTPFLTTPIAHLVSMGSLHEAIDQVVQKTAQHFPSYLGFHTHSQAASFGLDAWPYCLANGIDLSCYDYCSQPKEELAWVGRLAPEKGLEDAIQAAQLTGMPLKIYGKLQSPSYWQEMMSRFPQAPVEYCGFLPTSKLQAHLRYAKALLMTPRWLEAFGNVAIEALACGVPIIAYRRGGPSEIVQAGKTGFLVDPDQVEALVEAIAQLDTIDRAACRQQAEKDFSLVAMGDRFEAWFKAILSA